MKQFEYSLMTLYTKDQQDISEVERAVNIRGRDGWELVAGTTLQNYPALFFKREITPRQ